MRVLVTTAISTANVPTPFFVRWSSWLQKHALGKEDTIIENLDTYILLGAGIINMARTKQIEYFLESEADWMVNIDCDQDWGENGISELIQTGGAINSSVVHMKSPPYNPNYYYWKDNEFLQWDQQIPDQPFEADGVGWGMIAISRSAAEDLYHTYGGELFERPVLNHWNNIYMGEDIAFCYRAREMNYKIMINPSIKTSHFNYFPIGRDDYNRVLLSKGSSIK